MTCAIVGPIYGEPSTLMHYRIVKETSARQWDIESGLLVEVSNEIAGTAAQQEFVIYTASRKDCTAHSRSMSSIYDRSNHSSLRRHDKLNVFE